MPALLVVGGTGFVGRAVVHAGLARGWAVTAFNSDRRGQADQRVEHVLGDRARQCDLTVLRGGSWDLIVDTWAGDPSAVDLSCRPCAAGTCQSGRDPAFSRS